VNVKAEPIETVEQIREEIGLFPSSAVMDAIRVSAPAGEKNDFRRDEKNPALECIIPHGATPGFFAAFDGLSCNAAFEGQWRSRQDRANPRLSSDRHRFLHPLLPSFSASGGYDSVSRSSSPASCGGTIKILPHVQ
jgi:hypothetical protein